MQVIHANGEYKCISKKLNKKEVCESTVVEIDDSTNAPPFTGLKDSQYRSCKKKKQFEIRSCSPTFTEGNY